MKKLTVFILTIFTVATLFAAARPSLDGRAVVADGGTMPKGLFARTVGYLPGDSVTVTNPATGSTTDVLVLGAIDPSEGVAILLSPEAADALRIAPNSNVQVKLTKRTGSLDENASGSAVLSNEELAAETVAEAEEVPSEEPSESDEIAEETAEIPEATVEAAAETAVAEAPATETVVEEAVVPEQTPAVVEEIVVPVVDPAEIAVVEETPVQPVGKADEIKAETAAPVPAETLQPVILVTTEEAPVPVEVEILPPVEEELPALVVEKEVEEPLQPVIIVETEVPAVEPVVEEVAKVEEEIPAIAEREPDVVVETEVSAEDESFQPIVLVPAGLNPPEADERAAAKKAPEPVKKVEEVVVAKEEPKIEPKVEPKPVVKEEPKPVVKEEPKVEKPVVTNDWTNYVVPSHKNLLNGCYYIQIASLANVDNIKNIIAKYSSKYPMVLIQSTNGKSYQILVGPLNIDEYGSVLAKFRAYGYKDAFVKKINSK